MTVREGRGPEVCFGTVEVEVVVGCVPGLIGGDHENGGGGTDGVGDEGEQDSTRGRSAGEKTVKGDKKSSKVVDIKATGKKAKKK